MKIQFILFLALILLGFSSCTKCITCSISGHSIDDSLYVDDQTILYDDFCGTLTETEAFEGDVKFEADSRQCVSYSLHKFVDDSVLANFHACGSIQDLQDFKNYLEDSVMTEIYAGQDVYLKLDSLKINPGTYSCIKLNE